MIFSWFKKRRRKKMLTQPFPEHWHPILKRNVLFYAELQSYEQSRIRDDMRILIAEKTWTGIGDLVIDEEMQVTVAAQAALLLLNIEHDYYDCTSEIILHRSHYHPHEEYSEDGLIIQESPGVLGQAYYRGPVILSWASAVAGGRNDDDGRNVVFHEFAHKLDMADDLTDGTPPLDSKSQYQEWIRVMSESFNELQERAEQGRATLLDKYGATDEAEFFACATESFFEKPKQLKSKHPELYNVLKSYYKQDPAKRKRNG